MSAAETDLFDVLILFQSMNRQVKPFGLYQPKTGSDWTNAYFLIRYQVEYQK